MYCIKCGVKLADTEKVCPLCGTRVFHPDLTQEDALPLYPREKLPPVQTRSKAPLAVVSALFLLPVLIVLLCDMQLSPGITWSGFVVGAVLTGYVMLILPFWFHRPNPVVLVALDFAAAILYLLYVDCATGGSWFLSFAFPVAGGLGLLVTAVVALLRYVPKGVLYILGGAFIALGLFMLLVEFLLDLTFSLGGFIGWSLYPLVVLVLLGGVLIFLAINRPAREIMERKLFL